MIELYWVDFTAGRGTIQIGAEKRIIGTIMIMVNRIDKELETKANR